MAVSLTKQPTLSLTKQPLPLKGNGGYPAWMGTKQGR